MLNPPVSCPTRAPAPLFGAAPAKARWPHQRPQAHEYTAPAPAVRAAAVRPRRPSLLQTGLCGLFTCLAPFEAYARQAGGVVSRQYQPSAAAVAICTEVARAMGDTLPPLASDASDLGRLDGWAAAHLRRPLKTERMAPAALAHYQSLVGHLTPAARARLVIQFERLGDIGAQKPKRRAYDYILIHGTTVQGMRDRVMAVAQAVSTGALQMTPKTQIVFLDGERPLFASEPERVLVNTDPYQPQVGWKAPHVLPTDERGAAELVWAQLPLPAAMRLATPMFVHAAKKPDATRAETQDTVAAWSKMAPAARGTALMVSDNPTIEYQRLVTQALLYTHALGHLKLDAMGPDTRLRDAPEAVRLGFMLDNLAACLSRARHMQAAGIPLG